MSITLHVPLRLNRGQAMSVWSLMAELTPDAIVEINEQRGDGELWATASSEFGSARYRLPASGGHFRVESQETPREPIAATEPEEVV